MLDVLRDAGRVAVTPFRKYFVAVGEVPVDQLVRRDGKAGLFRNFPGGGEQERLVALLAAGDRLPEAGMGGALEQQYVEFWRVNQDQDGNRLFQSSPGR